MEKGESNTEIYMMNADGSELKQLTFNDEYDGHWPSWTKSMPLYYNAHLEWFHEYLGGEPAPWDSGEMVRNRGYGEKIPD